MTSVGATMSSIQNHVFFDRRGPVARRLLIGRACKLATDQNKINCQATLPGVRRAIRSLSLDRGERGIS